MKPAGIFVLVLILCGMLAAQTQAAPPATPPPHHEHHGMAGPGPDHMQAMKDHLAKMRSTLDQMKTNQATLKDPAAKKQAQLNIDLWEGMVQHMEAMAKMMSEHHGPDMMGGMHHGDMAEMHHDGMGGGMGCCAGMKEGGGCCGGMKDGGGCCGGGKCMQGGSGTKTEAPPSADKNDK